MHTIDTVIRRVSMLFSMCSSNINPMVHYHVVIIIHLVYMCGFSSANVEPYNIMVYDFSKKIKKIKLKK
jgi:hypothetical protein